MAERTHLLTSRRLALRPVARTDVPALHAHWTDANVRRYLWDGTAISRERVAAIVERSEALFAQQAYGLWAVRFADEDAVIGCGGYWFFHEPPQLELVISLAPAYWNQGLAAEAANALVGYAVDELGMDEILASTDTANAASRRLLERLGFDRTRRATADGLDTTFYALRPPR